LHSGYLRLQIHTLRLCNAHCFSTTTMVARTRLTVTLYVHCLSCCSLPSITHTSGVQPDCCPIGTGRYREKGAEAKAHSTNRIGI
jgi:hypothetical protein